MSELYTCDHCHAQSSIYWHPISRGMVSALAKLKQAVLTEGRNSIHTTKDMDGTSYELTKGEYANFTMLRYHALVAKDKAAGKGHWLITHRGSEFLKGNVTVPAKVQVLNNEVIGHDDLYISVGQVMKGADVPYWQEIELLERERLPIEVSQGSFDLGVEPEKVERSYH